MQYDTPQRNSNDAVKLNEVFAGVDTLLTKSLDNKARGSQLKQQMKVMPNEDPIPPESSFHIYTYMTWQLLLYKNRNLVIYNQKYIYNEYTQSKEYFNKYNNYNTYNVIKLHSRNTHLMGNISIT